MSNKGHSEPNFWGGYDHYDEHGHKTGHSEPNFWGGFNEYDNHGNKTGRSEPTFWGGYDHYDKSGHKTGHSERGFFGGYDHYDKSGHKTGHSDPGFLGGYSHERTGSDGSSSEGCYIATCVYGSYDCPEVWTLRRFRDFTLAESVLGRAFIKCYYAVSPTVVRWFGESTWFRASWRWVLDKMIRKLRAQGVENTPYRDRKW